MARTKAKSCTGKKAMSLEEAKQVVEYLKIKTASLYIHYYKCEFSDHDGYPYHIGHKSHRYSKRRRNVNKP